MKAKDTSQSGAKEITPNGSKFKDLAPKSGTKEIAPIQLNLLPEVVAEKEAKGIDMGVLADGTPFLSQRGLARLCGVQNAHIGTISSEWGETAQKPRITAIKDLLAKRRIRLDSPHIQTKDRSGRLIYAYPDTACAAILEYYAFEAGANCKEEAKAAFRELAGQALRDFIYREVGYTPNTASQVWQQFHDRVSLNYHTIPLGYFSVFKEIADMIVSLIRGGAAVGPKFIPDISVGGTWATHWKNGDLSEKFGDRIQYDHSYPDYFPQSLSNPQPAYAYPDAALAEFRRWFNQEYLVKKLPSYLYSSEKAGKLPPAFSEAALKALADRRSPPKIIN
jgi:hypothetical protein